MALESTPVDWIPRYEWREARGMEVWLVNARHLRQVPGRKTALQACQWRQWRHSRGLVRGSFRSREGRPRLRALPRPGSHPVEERGRCVRWRQQALAPMNGPGPRAGSARTGATGLQIVRASVAGARDLRPRAAWRPGQGRKSAAAGAAHRRGTGRAERRANLALAVGR